MVLWSICGLTGIRQKKQKKQKAVNKNILYPPPCPATADQKNIFWAYKIV
jgi:hypothetical protein